MNNKGKQKMYVNHQMKIIFKKSHEREKKNTLSAG